VQISGPQTQGFEGIFATFWLRTWDLVTLLSPDATGHTTRGHLAFLDIKPISDAPFTAAAPTRDVPIGQSVTSGVESPATGNQADWLANLVGVIESDLRLAREIAYVPAGVADKQHVKQWVVVQTYGYHNAIATIADDAAGADPVADAYLYVNMADDRGIVHGHTIGEVAGMNTVSGANTVLFSGKPLQTAGFVGYRAGSARARFADASSAGFNSVFSTIPGFIMCMGGGPRG